MAKISDAELLNAELSVTDAYAQGGHVLEKLPKGVDIADVIHSYSHERYPAEKVFCCICGNAKHKSGWRVRRSDDDETFVGSCCGKDVAKQFFHQGTNRLQDYKIRKEYLQKIHDLLPKVLTVRLMLQNWDQLARQLRTARYEFKTAMPGVYERLQQAATGTGELIAFERTGYDDDDMPIDVTVRHVLTGRKYLRQRDPVELTKAVENALYDFRDKTGNTEAHSTRTLKRSVTNLEKAIQALSVLADMANAVDHFFGGRNLAGIQQWADILRAGHSVELKHDIIAAEGSITNASTGVRVEKPTGFVIPSSEIFRSLSSTKSDAA